MSDLLMRGYQAIDGPFALDEMSGVARAYDDVLASLGGGQFRHGSTTTRFTGLAGLSPFHRIYTHRPLLDLAFERIGAPFKLSSLLGRTLRPGAGAPPLHQDVKPGADGDPLVAFIFMVDAFTPDNGATRFLPGSQGLSLPPVGVAEQRACGTAGSIVVFDGTIWHEHGPHIAAQPRRSVQGYFVRRDHTSGVSWREEISREEAATLPTTARDLMGL